MNPSVLISINRLTVVLIKKIADFGKHLFKKKPFKPDKRKKIKYKYIV